MALPKPVWRQRVRAAAELHGLTLAALDERLAGRGLPIRAVGRSVHDSDDYMPSRVLALALADELDLPVAWFEAEDWRPLILDGATAPDEREGAGVEALRVELRSMENRLAAGLAMVRTALEAPPSSPASGARRRAGNGS